MTAKAVGSVIITATSNSNPSLSAICTVEVIQKAESVTLNKTELELNTGESETLIATVSPIDADDTTVAWKSNNEAIAKVDSNGKVTAVATGTTVITATSNSSPSLSATCDVIVAAPLNFVSQKDGSTIGWSYIGTAPAGIDIEYSCNSMFNNCSSLKVREESGTDDGLIFICPGTIPNNSVTNMFANTGGQFKSSPNVNKTYYWYK